MKLLTTEIEKRALRQSQSTVYTDTLAEIEEINQIVIDPIAYGETKRIIAHGRVLCIYRMDSGRYECFSYLNRSRNGI